MSQKAGRADVQGPSNAWSVRKPMKRTCWFCRAVGTGSKAGAICGMTHPAWLAVLLSPHARLCGGGGKPPACTGRTVAADRPAAGPLMTQQLLRRRHLLRYETCHPCCHDLRRPLHHFRGMRPHHRHHAACDSPAERVPQALPLTCCCEQSTTTGTAAVGSRSCHLGHWDCLPMEAALEP